MAYTTTDLLARIKQKAMIPDSQTTFDDDSLLAIADDEIALRLVPAILSTREDFYLTSVDCAAAASVDIPERAIGMKLKRVCFVDSAGSEEQLVQVDPMQGEEGFYLQGNKVYFTYTPTDTIRLYYYICPGKLIPTSKAAVVVSVLGSAITVVSVPSAIASGASVDFIKNKPGYDTLALDQTATTVASPTLTMATAPTSDLAAGHYIALAGYSPVVQVPEALVGALEWAVAASVLEALGDTSGAALASQKADRSLAAGVSLFEPRIDGVVKKIINYDSELRGRPYKRNNNTW
jgi:hypothetical protein